ncbi:MAG: aldolase/citrate lyase family protein [Phycisphaerae bacterium]
MQSFKEILKSKPQLGLSIMYPAPGVIERIGPDWDWIWIDGQHGQLDYHDILAMVRVCSLIDRPAIVRVPSHESGLIGLTLDMGAQGIMVPVVDTAEQARNIVQAAKFPPLGSRSFGGRRPIDLWGRGYCHTDRGQPLLICQIETEIGLENASAIAEVEGVDLLFFGPDDMALRNGLIMDQPRPRDYFDSALKKVAQAAHSHQKLTGGVFTNPDAVRQASVLGYRLLVGSGDVGLLAEGSKNQAKALQQAITSTQEKLNRNPNGSPGIY